MALTVTPPQTLPDALQNAGLWRHPAALRLHLGCGETRFDGYINIDYPPSEHTVMTPAADVFADITKMQLPDNSIDEIRLHHVFEHFNRITALVMLVKWHRALKIGGKLHIETPDLAGSAENLLSPFSSWRTRMSVARHLAGDQAAAWAYHVDHWFAARFVHTFERFGFDQIATRNWKWDHEPFIANVEAVGFKTRELSLKELTSAAEALLWESTVADAEKPTYQVWIRQMHELLAATY